ncbi:hypothetical protein EV361DRAFT_1034965, partial [Lentinula raphanica]
MISLLGMDSEEQELMVKVEKQMLRGIASASTSSPATASTGSSAFFWSSLLRFVFFACFHNDDENANGSDNAAKHTKHSLRRHRRGLLLVDASNLDRGHRSRGGKEIETVGTTMGGLGGISGHPQPSGTRSSSTVNTTSTTSTSTEAPPNSTSLMNTTKPPHPLLPAHHQPLPNFLLPGWTFNVQEEEDSTTSGGGEAEATSSVVKANKGMIDMILRLPVDKSVDKIRYLQQLVTVQGARSMELERREECVLVEEKEESLVVLPLLNVLVRDVPLFLVVRARARTKKFNQVEFGGGFCEQFLVVEAEEDEEKKEGVDAEPVLSALALDQNTPSPKIFPVERALGILMSSLLSLLPTDYILVPVYSTSKRETASSRDDDPERRGKPVWSRRKGKSHALEMKTSEHLEQEITRMQQVGKILKTKLGPMPPNRSHEQASQSQLTAIAHALEMKTSEHLEQEITRMQKAGKT